jgi:hypothetical protein
VSKLCCLVGCLRTGIHLVYVTVPLRVSATERGTVASARVCNAHVGEEDVGT